MGFWETTKKVLLVSAIAVAATYYFKPEYFRKGVRYFEAAKNKIEEKLEDGSKQNYPLAGTYSCSLDSQTEILRSFGVQVSNRVSIKERNGKYTLITQSGAKFPIELDSETRFTYNFNTATSVRNGSGHLDKNGNLILKMSGSGGGLGATKYTCMRVGAKKKDETIRAVFIRPCEGQLYESFGFRKGPPGFPTNPAGDKVVPGLPGFRRATLVGGGSLKSVCEDLKESGVTDVFLPFKVDHEGKGCGNYGELLYDSKNYPERVSPSFKQAIDNGFDPIGNLMTTCKSTYGQKPKKEIRFHAWFPVFRDPYAAEIQPQVAMRNRDIFTPIGDFFSSLTGGGKPEEVIQLREFAEPLNPQVVEYQLKILAEILGNRKRYPLVGINLDYIRYSDSPEGYEVIVNADAVTDFVRQAGEGPRQGVGQNGILIYLDMIMPMEYTYFAGFEGDDEVKKRASMLKEQHPNKKLIPILRGWVCRGKLESCSLFEEADDTIKSLKSSVAVVREIDANGWGLFTYESFLSETGITKLKELVKDIR